MSTGTSYVGTTGAINLGTGQATHGATGGISMGTGLAQAGSSGSFYLSTGMATVGRGGSIFLTVGSGNRYERKEISIFFLNYFYLLDLSIIITIPLFHNLILVAQVVG